MSLRASASRPMSCSGAMYGNVPSTAPTAVSGGAAPGETVDSASRSGLDWCFERPKSSSFAPSFVNITLPGLRSR